MADLTKPGYDYLDFNTYQNRAERTAAHIGEHTIFRTLIAILHITSEAGEIANFAKKVYSHGHEFDRAKFVDEIGDVLWGIAELCSALDIPMSECASGNIEKLQKRYPHGFSTERSVHRDADHGGQQ